MEGDFMNEKLNIAIVGAGNISDSHANSWQKSGIAQIAAVVDIRLEAAKAKAEKWGGDIKVFQSIDQLADKYRPDIIDICTPEHVHKILALQALAADIPVFCEKMMASDLSDGLTMFRQAREKQNWTGMNYNYHFFPGIRQLKEVIERAESGDLRVLNVITHSFCFHHILESIIWLCGMPRAVSAQGTGRDWPKSFHDQFKIADNLIYIPGKAMTARLEFDSGLVCSLTSSYHQSLSALPFHITAIFDTGKALAVSQLDWSENMVGRFNWLPDGENLVSAFYQNEDTGNELSFNRSIEQAAQSFSRGEEAESTWENGWNVMVLDHALYHAGKQGKLIDVYQTKALIEQ